MSGIIIAVVVVIKMIVDCIIKSVCPRLTWWRALRKIRKVLSVLGAA